MVKRSVALESEELFRFRKSDSDASFPRTLPLPRLLTFTSILFLYRLFQVDTLEWCRERISELNRLIEEKRKEVDGDYQNYPPQNSAFVLFNTQIAAHMAVKSHAHHAPYTMADNYVE